MPREGGGAGEDRRLAQKEVAAQVQTAPTLQPSSLSKINTQINVAQAATIAFEEQQRAFEKQIAALGQPADPSQFGQAPPDLSFTPGDFAGPSFDRTPPSGVGLTTAREASSRAGSPTAAFTLSNIQDRFGGAPRSVPKTTTSRGSGTTRTKPEGIISPVQRVLGDRTRTRLGGQGKF